MAETVPEAVAGAPGGGGEYAPEPSPPVQSETAPAPAPTPEPVPAQDEPVPDSEPAALPPVPDSAPEHLHKVRLADAVATVENFFARNPALDRALITDLTTGLRALERFI